jgi:hypothetical protein
MHILLHKEKIIIIELYRFSYEKDYVDFEVLLENISRCYCGSSVMYVRGIIEFRAIENGQKGTVHIFYKLLGEI